MSDLEPNHLRPHPTPQCLQKEGWKAREMMPNLTASQEGLSLSHLAWTKIQGLCPRPHRPIRQ